MRSVFRRSIAADPSSCSIKVNPERTCPASSCRPHFIPWDLQTPPSKITGKGRFMNLFFRPAPFFILSTITGPNIGNKNRRCDLFRRGKFRRFCWNGREWVIWIYWLWQNISHNLIFIVLVVNELNFSLKIRGKGRWHHL